MTTPISIPPPPQTTTAPAGAAPAPALAAVASSGEALTFDGIAKYFSMPIADAANALGVCNSVLKKICRDNGLDRWPYRKFLAGKSVEEIQKDAARERKKEMLELARVARQKDPNPSSVLGSTTSQQQGNKLSQDGWPSDTYLSTKNIPAYLDEFKQGFPSSGLQTVTLRWWGDHSPESNEDETATGDVNKKQSHNEDEVSGEEPASCKKAKQQNNEQEKYVTSDKVDSDCKGASLLLVVRERAAAEGREALKLGVYKGHRSFKLNRREKSLLFKVFKSSLPSHWINDS